MRPAVLALVALAATALAGAVGVVAQKGTVPFGLVLSAAALAHAVVAGLTLAAHRRARAALARRNAFHEARA